MKVLLIVLFLTTTHAQTFELQRAKVVDGKLVILSTKRYDLAHVYKEQAKLYRHLKPGEWLIGPSVIEQVEVVVKEVDDEPLTVSATGFNPKEVAAIQRALTAWGRFTWSDNGQIKIRRGSLKVMALSVMQIQDDRLVSADVVIDFSVTDSDALQSTVAHEAGHWLGLPDSNDKCSVMYFKSRGRNQTNGHVAPTSFDLQQVRNLRPE